MDSIKINEKEGELYVEKYSFKIKYIDETGEK